MSVIGTFKDHGTEFTGESATLTIRATNVRIVPTKRNTDAGPSHRVYVGHAEVGAAWYKLSKEGRPYLSVLLDDPSLAAPVYASLLVDENGKGDNLVWTRGQAARRRVNACGARMSGAASRLRPDRPSPKPSPIPRRNPIPVWHVQSVPHRTIRERVGWQIPELDGS